MVQNNSFYSIMPLGRRKKFVILVLVIGDFRDPHMKLYSCEVWLIQGVPGGMDKTSGECSLG